MRTTGKVLKPTSSPAERVQFPAFARNKTQESQDTEQIGHEPSAVISEPVVRKPPPQQPAQPDSGEGYRSGYREGMQQAREDGYKQGFQQGQEEGLRLGREEGFRVGSEEGRRQGHQEGYASGMAQGEKDLHSLTEQVNSHLTQVQQIAGNHRQSLSQWLSELVETIVRQVIRLEMRNRPDQIQHVIDDVLKQLPAQNSKFRVRLNPVDAEKLIQFRPELRERWSLIEAPEIAPGDCRIEAEQTEADASLEQRLHDCMELVRQHMPSELEKQLL